MQQFALSRICPQWEPKRQYIFPLAESCRNLRDSQKKWVWSRMESTLFSFALAHPLRKNISTQTGNLESIIHFLCVCSQASLACWKVTLQSKIPYLQWVPGEGLQKRAQECKPANLKSLIPDLCTPASPSHSHMIPQPQPHDPNQAKESISIELVQWQYLSHIYTFYIGFRKREPNLLNSPTTASPSSGLGSGDTPLDSKLPVLRGDASSLLQCRWWDLKPETCFIFHGLEIIEGPC